jgi:hypothetical protein
VEKTQKLLTIALAVLALDGCRGASTQHAAAPGASGSPTPAGHGSHYYGGHHGSFAAGAAAGILLGRHRNAAPPAGYHPGYGGGTVDRTLGGNRSVNGGGIFGGRGGGFGGSGARGFGG